MINSLAGCWLPQYGMYCVFKSQPGRALLSHGSPYDCRHPIGCNHRSGPTTHITCWPYTDEGSNIHRFSTEPKKLKMAKTHVICFLPVAKSLLGLWFKISLWLLVSKQVNIEPLAKYPTMLSAARKRAIEKSTLVLKPRADVTRSPRQGYQWLHKKDLCLTKNLKTKQKKCFQMQQYGKKCWLSK